MGLAMSSNHRDKGETMRHDATLTCNAVRTTAAACGETPPGIPASTARRVILSRMPSRSGNCLDSTQSGATMALASDCCVASDEEAFVSAGDRMNTKPSTSVATTYRARACPGPH